MRVLGVDPGATVGLALLEVRGGVAWWCGDDSTRDALASDLVRDELDLVVIEKVGMVFASEGFSPWIATTLMRADRVAERIKVHFEQRRIPIREVAASTWRKHVIGKGNAGDALIRDTIELVVRDWPKRSSVHVRDAAGCALWGARTVELERRAATQAGAAR